jgi:hypothetical protein
MCQNPAQMSRNILVSLFGLLLSLTASGAGLGFNPFQKPVSPTSPGGTNQKPPPVSAPAPNTQPSKPAAPASAPVPKTENQSKK